MQKFEFTYASRLTAEERMLDDLDSVCRESNLSEALSFHFKLVVSEAFCNAIVHGNRLDHNKQVRLILTLNEFELVADIIDQGRGGSAKTLSTAKGLEVS